MNGLGFLAGRLDGVVVKLDIGDRVWTTGFGGSRRRMSNFITWLSNYGDSVFSGGLESNLIISCRLELYHEQFTWITQE